MLNKCATKPRCLHSSCLDNVLLCIHKRNAMLIACCIPLCTYKCTLASLCTATNSISCQYCRAQLPHVTLNRHTFELCALQHYFDVQQYVAGTFRRTSTRRTCPRGRGARTMR